MSIEKAAFRKIAADKEESFTPDYLKKSDVAITNQVLSSIEYQCARTVFCYVSMKKEPDTHEILFKSMQLGKVVCVPYCESDGTMTARKINSFSELKDGRFGFHEPSKSAIIVPPSEIDLCIVPCVCSDENGYRIGHGGGYYDKFLHNCRAKKILLCRKELVMAKLPVEKHDIKCDRVITG